MHYRLTLIPKNRRLFLMCESNQFSHIIHLQLVPTFVLLSAIEVQLIAFICRFNFLVSCIGKVANVCRILSDPYVWCNQRLTVTIFFCFRTDEQVFCKVIEYCHNCFISMSISLLWRQAGKVVAASAKFFFCSYLLIFYQSRVWLMMRYYPFPSHH